VERILVRATLAVVLLYQKIILEGLSEEELAIFDLLALNITLSEEEHSQVKAPAAF
jgi:hypothetical protein